MIFFAGIARKELPNNSEGVSHVQKSLYYLGRTVIFCVAAVGTILEVISELFIALAYSVFGGAQKLEIYLTGKKRHDCYSFHALYYVTFLPLACNVALFVPSMKIFAEELSLIGPQNNLYEQKAVLLHHFGILLF